MKGIVWVVFLFYSSSFGQRIFSGADHVPAHFHRVDYTYCSVIENNFLTGDNVTWDFSQLQESFAEPQSVLYLSPPETRPGYLFSSSTLSEGFQNSFSYYQHNEKGLFLTGSAIIDSVNDEVRGLRFYEDPKLLLPEALQYGQVVADSFASSFNDLGNSIDSKGLVNIAYVGFGSLIIGNSFIDSVILLHKYSVTEFMEGSSEISNVWEWFEKDNRYPLIRYVQDDGPNHSIDFMLKRNAVTDVTPVIELPSSKSRKVYYDGSDSRLICFNYQIDERAISVYNSLGMYVCDGQVERTGDDRVEVKFPELNSGCYFLKCNGNKLAIRFFVN